MLAVFTNKVFELSLMILEILILRQGWKRPTFYQFISSSSLKIFLTIAVSFLGQALSAQNSVSDSLRRIVSLQRHDSTELNALLNLSFELSRNDPPNAKVYAHQAVKLAQVLKKDSRVANGYQYLVTLSQSSGQPDSALHYLKLMENLVQSNPSISKIKISYNQAAGLFFKNQGQYSKALPYMLETLKLLPYENENRAGLLLNLGNTFYELGDYKNAMTNHLQSLTLFEKLNSKRGQSFCLQSLGNDFFELGQYAAAKKYLLQSEKIKRELGDKRGELSSWMTLGSVYQQTNKPEISMNYFKKALVRARELKLVTEESQILFNLGSLLKTIKKPDEASKRFSEGLLLARQLGDSSLVSRIKTYIVAMQTDMEKEKVVEQTLLDNIEISLEKGALSNTAEGHFELARWYESRKQFDKALENLKKGQQLNDSLTGKEVILQIKNLEEAYKSDKKEKEIALLKKDQELQKLEVKRQQANTTIIAIALISVVIISIILVNRYRVVNRTRRLVEIERMRNTIARDLHDDIGSTLSSINIISQMALQEQNARLPDGQGNIATFQRIAQHASNMMESMSDIVWSINPNNDSGERVISKMKEFTAEMLDPLDINYKFSGDETVDALELDVTKRKNLFLIFKEAINNAAKYSSATLINIHFRKENNFINIHIADNGKGFDIVNSTKGNGLRNMKERAENINAKLEIISDMNLGTTIALTLPIT